MNHAIIRLKQIVDCAEPGERLPRFIHFLETVVASFAWPSLAAAFADGRCPRDLAQVTDFGKPSFGNYLNWLDEILRPPTDQPYLRLVRECLRDRMHGDRDDLPIRPIARCVSEMLDLPPPGKSLSLLTFFKIMGSVRNQMAHPTAPLPASVVDAIVQEIDRRQLLDHLLQYLAMLADFPLAYLKSNAEGDRRNMIICDGERPLGAESRLLRINDSLSDGHLYLLDVRSREQASVVAEVSPFMLVRKSGFAMANQLFFLAEVLVKSDGCRHEYCTYLDRETHEELHKVSPLSSRLAEVRGTSRRESSASEPSVPPANIRVANTIGAVETSDVGYLKVQVLPAAVGVAVAFRESRADATDDLCEVRTLEGGDTPWVTLPVGKVDVCATLVRQEGPLTTEVRVSRRGVPVKEASERTVILGLPGASGLLDDQIAAMESYRNMLAWVRRRWMRLAAACVTITLFAMFAVQVVRHLTWAPDSQVYVPADSFEVGLVSAATSTDRTHKMLAIVSDVANDDGVDVGKLFSVIATSPPRDVQVDDFYVEAHEVSVQRYAEFLESLRDSPEEQQRMEPVEWAKQVASARSGREWRSPSLPVVNVSFSQAEAFCEYVSKKSPSGVKARLITSEEWEVIARNMQPEEFDKWTIYPWGDEFFPGMAATRETVATRSPQPLTESLDKAQSRRIWGLGGNVSEWTKSPTEDGMRRIVRGADFETVGIIFSMGHVIPGRYAPDDPEDDTGFRLAYDANPGLDDVERVRGGRFRVGHPPHPLFRLMSALGTDTQYVLTAPQRREMVGDFLVMSHKVTQGEYRKFLASTKSQSLVKSRAGQGATDHDDIFDGRDEDPVLGLSWQEAFAYCKWKGGRLPTAEEWERIGRGTAGTPGRVFPWGDFVSAQEAEKQLQVFLNKPPANDSERLIRSMWSHGPEWTSSSVIGEKGEQRRILKGLPPKNVVKFDCDDLKNQSGYLSYVTTFRVPANSTQRIPGVGFRVVFDTADSWFERIGLTPGFKRRALVETPSN